MFEYIQTRSCKNLFIGIVAATVLAFSTVEASSQDFMTQEQLLALIPGATIKAKDNKGTPWTQVYGAYNGTKKKGKITGDYDGTSIKSKWYVNGNQWCEDWGSGHACWDVELVGARSVRMYENGVPKKNVWKLQ